MKPHPDVINRALHYLGRAAYECCMIGDSATDIEVSLATGVHPIGYAKNQQRGRELHTAGASALVLTMQDLADAIHDHAVSI